MEPLRAITAASIFGRRLSLVTLAAGLALGASVPCAGGARAASRDPFAGAEPRGVEIAMEGKTLRVTMPRSAWQDPARDVLADRDFMALLPVDFGDGVIEVEVKSSLAPGAPAFARGFVGIAFHVADGRFEKFYLRPANGIA